MKLSVNMMILGLLLCSSILTKAQSTWFVQNSGSTSDLNAADFYNEDFGLVVGNEGTILRTTDGGINWNSITSPVSNDLYGVSFIDSSSIMITGAGGLLLKSTDAGDSWSVRTVSGVNSDLLSIDFEPGGNGIACGKSQVILWTNDEGENWSILRNLYIGTFYSAQMFDAQTAFIYGENSIMNHLIGKVTQPGDSLSFTYFYINVNNIFTEGKVRDGHFFNMDSCVTVGAIFPGDAVITRNQPWGNEEWFPVWFSEGSTLNGLDFQGNYGVTVGGSYNNSDALLLETWDKGASWVAASDHSDKTSMNQQVKIIGSTAYVVGQGGKILKKMGPTGMNDPEIIEASVVVYPNPTSEIACFRMQLSPNTAYKLIITNPQGKKVLEKMINSRINESGFEVNIQGFAPGCYYYSIYSESTTTSGKLIVSRKK